MKKLILLLCLSLTTSCTSQYLALTTKSIDDLERYNDKTASEFIHNRYITKYDTAGIGWIRRGADALISGASAVYSKLGAEVEFTDVEMQEKLNVVQLFYNLSDYHRLLKPKLELTNLCSVHGGILTPLKLHRTNIATQNLDNYFRNNFRTLAANYMNAGSIAANVNSSNTTIDIAPNWGIPLLANTQDIRQIALQNMRALEQKDKQRAASNTRKMLNSDMAIDGESALQEAIDEESFGVFQCSKGKEKLWRVSILPLWNEVLQQQATSVAYVQIAADDGEK